MDCPPSQKKYLPPWIYSSKGPRGPLAKLGLGTHTVTRTYTCNVRPRVHIIGWETRLVPGYMPVTGCLKAEWIKSTKSMISSWILNSILYFDIKGLLIFCLKSWKKCLGRKEGEGSYCGLAKRIKIFASWSITRSA